MPLIEKKQLYERELIALLNLSSWCLVMVERLFLTVPWGCLQFVIVVFPDHTHLLFFMGINISICSNHFHETVSTEPTDGACFIP